MKFTMLTKNHNLSALLHYHDSWIRKLSITWKNLIIFCKTQQLQSSGYMLFVDRHMCSFSYWSSATSHTSCTLREQQTPCQATQEKMDPHNLRSSQLMTTFLRPMKSNPPAQKHGVQKISCTSTLVTLAITSPLQYRDTLDIPNVRTSNEQ